jgi:exopolysaccharide production protein ExoY
MDFVLETTPLSPPGQQVAGRPRIAVPASVSDAMEPIAFLQPSPSAQGSERLIRLLDIVISFSLLVFFLPLMLIVAAILSPSGKVLFAQRRIGRDGQEFHCLKFRTMVVDAEARLQNLLKNDPVARAEWAHNQKLKNDPRITPVGRFLRRTSLDELPQLLNILGGSMSIVGPRPIVRSEVERYGRHFPKYCAVKPGLTGLWQVSGRSDTNYGKRVALDILYVKRRSVQFYMIIVLKTPLMVLGAKGSY